MNNCALRGVAVALFLLGANAALGAILENTTEQVYDLSPHASISIRNTDGRINIYASDTPHLKVKAVRRAFTKERLEMIKVDVVVRGASAVIETTIPPAPKGSMLADRSGTVDYTIVVPQDCTLSRVELANGEIVIEGVYGSGIDARLNNGRMQLTNCFSAARVSVGQGGLDVFHSWWDARAFTLSADVGNGDIRVDFPPDASLRLDAATTNGHITNRFATDKDGGHAQTLVTTIGGGSATEFKLRTTNGNIRIGTAY